MGPALGALCAAACALAAPVSARTATLGAGVAVDGQEEFSCPVALLEVVPACTGGGAGEGSCAVGDAPADGPAERLELVEQGLAYLEGLPPPLLFVSAVGVYRGGKSFLLNRLRGLRAPYHSGFGVGHAQSTHTRGASVCAEAVEGVGTVVWMDTEGLFSTEDARNAHGTQLFSLALLFSSAVLLNSVKVLNDQFFGFFREQEQVARILRHGLAAQGLPPGVLLPSNLSVTWVLQQPIAYDATGVATRQQLDGFLAGPKSREVAGGHVLRDFNHSLHEVPMAAADARLWQRLDAADDADLLPEYLESVARLRESVFSLLHGARALDPAGIAGQLRMYLDLVRTEQLNGGLVRQAFEDAEASRLCAHFGSLLDGHVPFDGAPLDGRAVQAALESARQELQGPWDDSVAAFSLGDAWNSRLAGCLASKAQALGSRNADRTVDLWRGEVSDLAERGQCYFMRDVDILSRRYAAKYGHAFGGDALAAGLAFARSVQRARLVECVRVKDLVWPLVPWMLWPAAALYLADGLCRGLATFLLHLVLLLGGYAVLQMLGRVPPWLDADFPLLRAAPWLLDAAMLAPAAAPWQVLGRAVAAAGLVVGGWKAWRAAAERSRPAGQGHTTQQLVNLELKVNAALRQSEALVRERLVAAALEAVGHLGRDQLCAALALLRCLSLAADAAAAGPASSLLDADVRRDAQARLRSFRMPEKLAMSEIRKSGEGQKLADCVARRKLADCVAAGDLNKLVRAAILEMDAIVRESGRE